MSWLQRDGEAPQEAVPQARGGNTAVGLTLPLNWQLTTSSERALFERLDQADRLWRPRVERLPGGGQRITYRRRVGEKPLSTAQLRQLIANTPATGMSGTPLDCCSSSSSAAAW